MTPLASSFLDFRKKNKKLAESRDRTSDLKNFSLTLFQLSYFGLQPFLQLSFASFKQPRGSKKKCKKNRFYFNQLSWASDFETAKFFLENFLHNKFFTVEKNVYNKESKSLLRLGLMHKGKKSSYSLLTHSSSRVRQNAFEERKKLPKAGIEPATLRTSVSRSSNWAISATCLFLLQLWSRFYWKFTIP